MQRKFNILVCAVLSLVAVVALALGTGMVKVYFADDVQRHSLLDHGWYFLEGDHPEAIDGELDLTAFDTPWQRIDLPHDFSALPRHRERAGIADSVEVIGPFSRSSLGKESIGWTLGGEGWYVRNLRFDRRGTILPCPSRAPRVELYFEGAYNQTYVWVNGHEVGSNMYGYSAFRFDITPYLLRLADGTIDTEADNRITVRVVNEGRNSRWYAGTGIYRHVWLNVMHADCHLDPWATQAHTTRLVGTDAQGTHASEALLAVSTEVQGQPAVVRMALLSPEGRTVATWTADEPATHHQATLTVADARLWTLQQPTLYTLRLSLVGNNGTDQWDDDQIDIPVGLRTIGFDAERGFCLNGVPTLLRGAAIHHDNGLLGARAYDRAEQRKVALLKAAGYNAIRGSHNPMSETLMDECDRQGMLVIDEAFDMWHKRKNKQDYHQYFDSLSTHDIQTLVRRDRNHPSVIMWSIGNEIPERAEELGVAIAARLRADIHALDTTRAVTAGINSIWNKDRTGRLSVEPACRSLDVAGYNYRVWNYLPEHLEDPSRVMMGTETVIGEVAYDWLRCEQMPWVIGDFLWTGMDYIGEAGIANCRTLDAQENVHFFMPWPWYNGWCGDIDLIGQDKPQLLYHQAVWGDRALAVNVEPARHGAGRPSISYWGWVDEQHQWYQPEAVGDTVRVNVYSRTDTLVHLYLNNVKVADVALCDSSLMGYAMIPYHPGTLRAEGASGASDQLTTPGQPVALRLTADRQRLVAGGQDLCYVLIELVDAEGRLVPETGRGLTLATAGHATLAGSGNAQPDDMLSFGSPTPTLFRGQAMAILRSDMGSGTATLTVGTEGLPSVACRVEVRSYPAK